MLWSKLGRDSGLSRRALLRHLLGNRSETCRSRGEASTCWVTRKRSCVTLRLPPISPRQNSRLRGAPPGLELGRRLAPPAPAPFFFCPSPSLERPRVSTLWPSAAQLWPSCLWPNSADFLAKVGRMFGVFNIGRARPRLGHTWPIPGSHLADSWPGPHLINAGPTWTDCNRFRPISGQLWPIPSHRRPSFTEPGPTLADLGPRFCRCRANIGRFGPIWSIPGQFGPSLADSGPPAADSGPSQAEVGPTWSKLPDRSTNLSTQFKGVGLSLCVGDHPYLHE